MKVSGYAEIPLLDRLVIGLGLDRCCLGTLSAPFYLGAVDLYPAPGVQTPHLPHVFILLKVSHYR